MSAHFVRPRRFVVVSCAANLKPDDDLRHNLWLERQKAGKCGVVHNAYAAIVEE
jgi:hypothetical protein